MGTSGSSMDTIVPNHDEWAEKIHGVNYGNRFVPEDWMKSPINIFDGVEAISPENKGLRIEKRKCLADLTPDQFQDRMIRHLEASILEEHFREMSEHCVNVVRLPTGYWNWVAFPGDSAPNGPDFGFRRMRRLQALPPSAYVVYFDRIVEYAKKYGIKVLWAANKRLEISNFKFKFPRARTYELVRARSRLYRSQHFASKY